MSGQDRSCSRQADGQLSPTANAAPRPRHCAAWSKRAGQLISWTDSRPYSRHQRPTRVDMQGIGTTIATGGRTSTQLSGRGISDTKGIFVRVAAHFLRPRVLPLKSLSRGRHSSRIHQRDRRAGSGPGTLWSFSQTLWQASQVNASALLQALVNSSQRTNCEPHCGQVGSVDGRGSEPSTWELSWSVSRRCACAAARNGGQPARQGQSAGRLKPSRDS